MTETGYKEILVNIQIIVYIDTAVCIQILVELSAVCVQLSVFKHWYSCQLSVLAPSKVFRSLRRVEPNIKWTPTMCMESIITTLHW